MPSGLRSPQDLAWGKRLKTTPRHVSHALRRGTTPRCPHQTKRLVHDERVRSGRLLAAIGCQDVSWNDLQSLNPRPGPGEIELLVAFGLLLLAQTLTSFAPGASSPQASNSCQNVESCLFENSNRSLLLTFHEETGPGPRGIELLHSGRFGLFVARRFVPSSDLL